MNDDLESRLVVALVVLLLVFALLLDAAAVGGWVGAELGQATT